MVDNINQHTRLEESEVLCKSVSVARNACAERRYVKNRGSLEDLKEIAYQAQTP